MEVEFDPAKAEKNLTKHGISFEEATSALLDPMALAFEDPDAEGESRATWHEFSGSSIDCRIHPSMVNGSD